jgi:hypothetical protein
VKSRRNRSAVEIRRGQITQQLEHLRSQLIRKSPTYYADENTYKRQLKRTRELISELESELSVLDCPGEYDELPIAIVADELGIRYEQVRGLIKLGEIEATGRAAHERISRGELERITLIGVPALMRLSHEDSAEIFEQAIAHLQCQNLEAVERAYRRLEARLSWRGPYAPTLLVGLELARGELDAALSSMELIYEYENPLRRIIIMVTLGQMLRGMRLTDKGSQELCEQFILRTEGAPMRAI